MVGDGLYGIGVCDEAPSKWGLPNIILFGTDLFNSELVSDDMSNHSLSDSKLCNITPYRGG